MVVKVGSIYQRHNSNRLFEFIGYVKWVEEFGLISVLAILRDIYSNELMAEHKYDFIEGYNYIRERE